MKIIIRILVFVIVMGLSVWGFFYILKGMDIPALPEVEDIIPIKIGDGGGIFGLGKKDVVPQEEETQILLDEGVLFSRVSDGPIFDYIVVSDEEIYYFADDGRVFRVSGGVDLIISEKKLTSLNGLWVSKNGKRAIVSNGDPNSPEWNLYDVLDGVWRPLPKTLKYAAWGHNDEILIGIEENDSKRSLVSVDLGKNTPSITEIFPNFSMKDVVFTSSGNNKIFITEKSSAFYGGSLRELNLRTFDITNIFSNEPGLSVKMFDGGGVKFSSPNKFSLLKNDGEVKKDFAFKTLPQKCGMEGITLYCFTANYIPEDLIFPDDYFKNKFYSTDYLYEINTDTFEEKIVFQSGGGDIPNIDGVKVFVTKKYVYFINKHDKVLYRLNRDLLNNENNKKPNVEEE